MLESQDPAAPETSSSGFWNRFVNALAGESSPPASPAPPPPPPPPPPAPVAGPRKPTRSVFDKPRKESRRTRLRRAAEEKRADLAVVVGEKVEKVLVEKIQPREDDLARVAQGFSGLSDVLNGLGRSLGAQGEQSVEQSRALRDKLEGVPDLVSLVKAGSGNVQGSLATLREVRAELELQRAQRERVVEGVARVESALDRVGDRLERALALVTERLEAQKDEDREQAALERVRAEEEAERFQQGLAVLAARSHEQASALLAGQEASAATFRAAQRAVVDGFEDSQRRTVEPLERLHEERARERARAGRRAVLAGTALAVLFGGLALGAGWVVLDSERAAARGEIAGERARAEAALEVARARVSRPPEVAPVGSARFAATTLPAGFAAVGSSVTATASTVPAGFSK